MSRTVYTVGIASLAELDNRFSDKAHVESLCLGYEGQPCTITLEDGTEFRGRVSEARLVGVATYG